MRTEDARKRYDPYVDGELSPADQAEFEATLAQDPEIGEDFAGYRAAVALVRGMPVAAPPEGFAALVRHRIRKRTRALGNDPRGGFAFEAACCTVLLAVVGALTLFAHRAPPAPAADRGPVGRVHLAPEDRQALERFGRIEAVGTSAVGPELVVHLLIAPDRLLPLRRALAETPRRALLPLSPQREGDLVRVRVRVPAGPIAPPSAQ